MVEFRETSGTNWAYAYDALDRLVSVRRNGTLIARYAYDVLGRRIVKRVYSTASGGTLGYLRMVYRGSHVGFETDSAGTIGLKYTWGAGTDQLLAITDGATHYYATTDRLGSVRSLAKRDGTWALTQRFSPYGVRMSRDTSASFGLGQRLRYGWTGREWDQETGMSYHRARYFLPTIRRWTQEDPIGYGGGGNVYAYVGGAALEATDPHGLAPGWGGGTNGWLYAGWYPDPPAKSGWDGWFGISGTLLPAIYTVVSDGRTAVWVPGSIDQNQWIADDYDVYASAFAENKQRESSSEVPIMSAGKVALTAGELWQGMTVLTPDQYALAVGFTLRDAGLKTQIQARFRAGNLGVGDRAPDVWAAANGRDPRTVWAATAGGWTSFRPTLFTGGPVHNIVVHESLHAFYPEWNERRTCFEANRLNVGRIQCI